MEGGLSYHRNASPGTALEQTGAAEMIVEDEVDLAGLL
jgi:hypothetical protein